MERGHSVNIGGDKVYLISKCTQLLMLNFKEM